MYYTTEYTLSHHTNIAISFKHMFSLSWCLSETKLHFLNQRLQLKCSMGEWQQIYWPLQHKTDFVRSYPQSSFCNTSTDVSNQATEMSKMVFSALTYFARKNGVLNCCSDFYEDFNESTEKNPKIISCWYIVQMHTKLCSSIYMCGRKHN